MARLRILLPNVPGIAGSEIDLRDPDMWIGSGPQCRICLRDPTVAQVHARLQRTPTGCWLSDQGSPTGTFVGGQRIGQHLLRHGDVIRVGRQQLVFLESAVARTLIDEPPAAGPPRRRKLGRVLAFAGVTVLLAAIGGGVWWWTASDAVKLEPLVSKPVKPNDDADQVVAYGDEIRVKVPFGLLKKEQTLSLARASNIPKPEVGSIVAAYDVTLGDMHALDGTVDIDFALPPGAKHGAQPACLSYLGDKRWEPMPCVLSRDGKRVTLLADHLSPEVLVSNPIAPTTGPMAHIGFVPYPFNAPFPASQAMAILQGRTEGGAGGKSPLVEGWEAASTWFNIGSAAGTSVATMGGHVLGPLHDWLEPVNGIAEYLAFGFALVQIGVEIADGDKTAVRLGGSKDIALAVAGKWGSNLVKVAGAGLTSTSSSP
jgi:hypothetical protein